MDQDSISLDDLHDRCTELASGLITDRPTVFEVLRDVATRASLIDEFHRSLRAIARAPFEILRNQPQPIRDLSVFFPSNNLLYSYTLYVLIPSLYCDRVIIRPSSRVPTETGELHSILSPLTNGAASCRGQSQREFVGHASASDAVIFTGDGTNAAHVRSQLGEKPVVLSFGSGPTPFVLGPHAASTQAVKKLVDARLFNSGQDCLCPDIVFVHRSVVSSVLHELSSTLEPILGADRARHNPWIVPIVYRDALQHAQRFLDEHEDEIVFGTGVIDGRLVTPTVVSLEWNPSFHPPEFFCPIFCIMSYDSPDDLLAWFEAPAQRRSGMYASIFGEPGLKHPVLGTTIMLRDLTPLDIEDGNEPFGGYGVDASCVQHAGVVFARPILLSAELSRHRQDAPADKPDKPSLVAPQSSSRVANVTIG